MRRPTLAAAALLYAGLLPCCAAGENLVHNGDLETESQASPPPGWVMWGAGKYKVAANYTRDARNARSGKAALRIHKPKNTLGYIVSDPARAIRPEKGMAYTFTFWAKTDAPGRCHFYVEAYASIKPYVDGPSPGKITFDAAREWKRHSLTVHEGWDFFAEQSRHLMLAFRAYSGRSGRREERTLWIDDVTVTARPSDRKGRLVDEATLKYEPMNHRLRPGERLEFAVDAKKRIRRITEPVSGISFHRVAGWGGQPYSKDGEWTLLPGIEKAIRDLRLPMTRFYAVGAERFSLEDSIDKTVEVMRRVGIPQETTPLEFEIQSSTSKLSPADWARGVRHSVRKGYKFRHWEIANEPYVKAVAYPTPDDYVAQVKAVGAAIRKEQPEAKIGVAISPGSKSWGNYVLLRSAGHYDFVVCHNYSFVDVHSNPFEAIALGANYRALDHILRTNALIRAYNPRREVYQYDTEWGMHSNNPQATGPSYTARNSNVYGAVHRAARLIHYAREGMLRGASSWEMFTSLKGTGFCVLSQRAPEKRSMIYWVYYHFNRHLGEWALETDGTAPWYSWRYTDGEYSGPLTPVLATLSKDGKKLYIVAVNGSWKKAASCRVGLRNFDAASATAVALSHDDPDAHPLLNAKEDFVRPLSVSLDGGGRGLTFTLPPHSAVFVTVTARGAR